MKGYTIRTAHIAKVDDRYNSIWNYRYMRYTLTDGTEVDVPYGCICKPMLREYRDGTIVNLEDLSSVVII